MTSPARILRAARRLVAALALAVALWSVDARASEGRPVGWAVETATEEIVVGRAVLRYDPALEAEAFELARRLPGWWSDIERELAGDLDDALVISFVQHSGRVAEATGMPEWAAGVADPPRGEVIIARHRPDGAPADLEALLRHELVHVALHRATGGAKVPRWFHEGVADSVGAEIDLSRAETLAGTIFGPGVPPLEDLDGQFRGDAQGVSRAYASARDFAAYLRYRDPDGTDFRGLLAQLRMGHGFEASFPRAYGIGLAELDGEWRDGLTGRFAWYPVLGSGGLPLVLLIPALWFAWWRRRRVLRQAWARLDRSEAPALVGPVAP